MRKIIRRISSLGLCVECFRIMWACVHRLQMLIRSDWCNFPKCSIVLIPWSRKICSCYWTSGILKSTLEWLILQWGRNLTFIVAIFLYFGSVCIWSKRVKQVCMLIMYVTSKTIKISCLFSGINDVAACQGRNNIKPIQIYQKYAGNVATVGQ